MSDGIDFLGYIVRRDYTLVRKRVVNNLRAKLQGFEAQLLRQRRSYRVFLYDSEVVDALVACLARHYLRMLVKAGWPVVCIVETGQYLSKIQERRVFCRVAPCYRMVGACDF